MTNATAVIFATLLTSSLRESPEHCSNVERWVKQLLCVDVHRENIAVLVTRNVDTSTVTRLRELGARVHTVPVVSVSGTARYRRTTTKIYLWTLVQYERIVYYDADMFFFQSPYLCLSACPESAELCAVSDPAATFPRHDPNYFNSGFMVLRPGLKTFQELKRNVHLAVGQTFGDQALFNRIFARRRVLVSKNCNFLHVADDLPGVARSREVVAVHEKVRFMRRLLPRGHRVSRCVGW